jgi:hypothetical protein
MNCEHCNMPQRRDYLLEFQCGTQRQVGHVTRSNRCYDNEIAQLKAKAARIEAAGDKLAARHLSGHPQSSKRQQHVREYHREKGIA